MIPLPRMLRRVRYTEHRCELYVTTLAALRTPARGTTDPETNTDAPPSSRLATRGALAARLAIFLLLSGLCVMLLLVVLFPLLDLSLGFRSPELMTAIMPIYKACLTERDQESILVGGTMRYDTLRVFHHDHSSPACMPMCFL